MLSRIANKAPVRGSARGARLKSTQAYYQIIDFLRRRCRAYSGAVDRAFIDGRLKLSSDLNVQCDAQVYQVNWISRLHRRNVELTTYCSVDAGSHFVLGMNCNFDGRVDPFEINRHAAQSGELTLAEPYREHAHYWLACVNRRSLPPIPSEACQPNRSKAATRWSMATRSLHCYSERAASVNFA